MGLACTAAQTNERDAKGTGLIMGQSLSAASAMGDARCLSSVFPGGRAPRPMVTPPRTQTRPAAGGAGGGVPRLLVSDCSERTAAPSNLV